MRISEEGLSFIKKWEGFREIPFKNSEKEKYYSIGFGHYGSDVKEDSKISAEEAEILLRNDIHKFEGRVSKYNNDYNFTQNQFDALVSFCYQVGDIDRLTNYGRKDKKDIANAMQLYCKFCGSINKDLLRRRKAERALFLEEGQSGCL